MRVLCIIKHSTHSRPRKGHLNDHAPSVSRPTVSGRLYARPPSSNKKQKQIQNKMSSPFGKKTLPQAVTAVTAQTSKLPEAAAPPMLAPNNDQTELPCPARDGHDKVFKFLTGRLLTYATGMQRNQRAAPLQQLLLIGHKPGG